MPIGPAMAGVALSGGLAGACLGQEGGTAGGIGAGVEEDGVTVAMALALMAQAGTTIMADIRIGEDQGAGVIRTGTRMGTVGTITATADTIKGIMAGTGTTTTGDTDRDR